MSGGNVELGASAPQAAAPAAPRTPATATPATATPRTLELRRGEAAPKDLAKLKEFAVGFESILTRTLLGELLKPMEGGGGFAGSGPGASVVQGLIETNLADHLSKSGGLGVGRVIVESMKPMLASQQVSIAELMSKVQQAAQRTPELESGHEAGLGLALPAADLKPALKPAQKPVLKPALKEEGR